MADHTNFEPKRIETKVLRLSLVPDTPRVWLPLDSSGQEDWAFVNFANSFDGYEFLGGTESVNGEFADAVIKVYERAPQILTVFNLKGLRALLFFAQRRAKWHDEVEVSRFAREVVEAIRKRLE
jgi:hypothetical protein